MKGIYEIRNVNSGNLMVASDSLHGDSIRYIVGWKSKMEDIYGKKWRFERLEDDEYKISCDDYDEYLYLDSFLDKRQSLNVFLSSDKKIYSSYEDADRWSLIQHKDGSFYLKNILRDQFLYEYYLPFDANGQYIFVSKNGFSWSKDNNAKRKWNLTKINEI